MKRIKAACIRQTLCFTPKEDVERTYALKLLKEGVKKYKAQLERSGTKHKIISEEEQSDGSVLIEIIKQYNSSPVGDYLK